MSNWGRATEGLTRCSFQPAIYECSDIIRSGVSHFLAVLGSQKERRQQIACSGNEDATMNKRLYQKGPCQKPGHIRGCQSMPNVHNNNKSIYIAPWLHVTLLKGAVTNTSKKPVKMLKVKIYKKNRKQLKTCRPTYR